MEIKKSLFAIFALSLPLVIQAQPSFITNGLLAYYPFNGTANDMSGHGNEGFLSAGIGFVADRYGNPNSALYFTNGAGGEMSTSLQEPDSASVSVTEWFNLPVGYSGTTSIQTWNAGNALIEFADSQSGAVSQFEKTLVVGPLNGGTTNFLGFYLSPGSTILLTTPGNVADGHWHQAVGTLSALGTMLYLDGNLVASNANTASANFNGYWRIDPNQGYVDDVRVYSRALSSSEVAELYAYEAPACLPHSALATPIVVNGFVVGATINDSGCGYTDAPLALILGGSGTGAKATTVVSNGVVVGITITDAGAGYAAPPSIYIYSPLGWTIGLIKAVVPNFSDLAVGTNYQLQSSIDLNIWSNQGPPFTATNPVMAFPEYFNTENTNRLFFRLEVIP